MTIVRVIETHATGTRPLRFALIFPRPVTWAEARELLEQTGRVFVLESMTYNHEQQRGELRLIPSRGVAYVYDPHDPSPLGSPEELRLEPAPQEPDPMSYTQQELERFRAALTEPAAVGVIRDDPAPGPIPEPVGPNGTAAEPQAAEPLPAFGMPACPQCLRSRREWSQYERELQRANTELEALLQALRSTDLHPEYRQALEDLRAQAHARIQRIEANPPPHLRPRALELVTIDLQEEHPAPGADRHTGPFWVVRRVSDQKVLNWHKAYDPDHTEPAEALRRLYPNSDVATVAETIEGRVVAAVLA